MGDIAKAWCISRDFHIMPQYLANLLSEIKLLLDDGQLNQDEAAALLQQQGISPEVFEFINS